MGKVLFARSLRAFALTFSIFMAACGGGGGASDSPSTSNTTGTTPSSNTPGTSTTSSSKAITAFYIGASAGTIDEAAGTISVNVPYGSDVTRLVATFTFTGSSVKVNGGVQTSGATQNNFSSPVTYTVVANDGSARNYTVTVTPAPLPPTTLGVAVSGLQSGKSLVLQNGSESLTINSNGSSASFATQIPYGGSYDVKITTLPAGQVCSHTYGVGAYYGVALSKVKVTCALPYTGAFTFTGSMSGVRLSQSATLLPSGKVLVTGGQDNGSILKTAELFDPATGAWTATTSMTTERVGHTATLLPNGKVLVAGGGTNSGMSNTAEVYDPVAETWTPTQSMTAHHSGHAATLLSDGTVLVGGASMEIYGMASERYMPSTNAWVATGPMMTMRSTHTFTLLPSGKVVAIGGGTDAWETYDPATQKWTHNGRTGRVLNAHTATLLPNGKVLVAGGRPNTGAYVNTAEIYDPITKTWSFAASMGVARVTHTATLLSNGKVLVVGGTDPAISPAPPGSELYDPVADSWTSSANLNTTTRFGHTATLLADGTLLVVGGGGIGATGTTSLLDSAELFH